MSSFFDKAKDAAQKAADLAADHTDKLDAGIDKASELADKATGGRFAGQLDTVQDKAHDAVGQLDKEPDGPASPSNPGH